MKMINAGHVRQLMSTAEAIESQRHAFESLASGNAWQPDKIGGGRPGSDDTLFCYAAHLGPSSGAAVKFGSVNPANASVGLPAVHAVIVLLDAHSGAPVAVIDGSAVTELRTSAASAVAVDALTAPDVTSLIVLGSGVQGMAHVRALSAVRAFTDTAMWSPDYEECCRATELLTGEGFPVRVAHDLDEVVGNADVIVCATHSTTPLFAPTSIKAGAAVLSIGSFERHRCEVGPELLRRSANVVVDQADTARRHCGPVVALAEDPAGPELVELGDVLTHRVTLSTKDDDVLTYLSVGLGIQDAAAAWEIYSAALASGLGTEVPW